MSDRSDAADLLAFQLSAAGIRYEREVRFHSERRWRFDFTVRRGQEIPEVAVEGNGGVWVNGRHNTGTGHSNDCEKVSVAAGLGWRVLQVTPDQVKSGQALQWIEAALDYRQKAKTA